MKTTWKVISCTDTNSLVYFFPLGQEVCLRPSEHDSGLRHWDVWRSGRNQLSVVQWVCPESGCVSPCVRVLTQSQSESQCEFAIVLYLLNTFLTFAQVSMWVQWSQGWLGHDGLSMTSGGTQSTWRAGWTALEYRERYRYPTHLRYLCKGSFYMRYNWLVDSAYGKSMNQSIIKIQNSLKRNVKLQGEYLSRPTCRGKVSWGDKMSL